MVCEPTYEDLFEDFRKDQTDPNVLITGGLVYKNGTIDMKKSYYLEIEP